MYSLAVKNFKLSEQDKNNIDKKIKKGLKKHLRPPFQIEIVLIKDTHHNRGDIFNCKMTVEQEGAVSHIDRQGSSVMSAMNEVVKIVRRELRKRHEKRTKKRWKVPFRWSKQ